MGFVDYSTLGIRHLGSIYEGLLEYKLMVAESDLVVSGSKKERRWTTLEDYNKEKSKKKAFNEFDEFDRARFGELYLATDNGERKATGSYYTPDYIVNYIVANTIGPAVDEKWKLAKENKSSFIDSTLSVKKAGARGLGNSKTCRSSARADFSRATFARLCPAPT